MTNDTNSYIETARDVINGELTKNTVTIEEIEFVCFYYFLELEKNNVLVNVNLIEAEDEMIKVNVSGSTLNLRTIDLFLAINSSTREDVIRLAQSTTIVEFLNKLNDMK
ncbi:hypothetical protein BTR19_19555 [Pseudomonas fluorescens]|nr:hypothetical protein BTR19_19555 [Pseudomonas fluorescens]